MISFRKIVRKYGLRWKALYLIRYLFKIAGRDWNGFYAWMLDTQDKNVTIQQILNKPRNEDRFKGLWDWWRGEYYWSYMKRHGVSVTDCIVDIGCGYGRVAIPILREQSSGGHYIGTEISAKRAGLTKDWIELEKLTDKSYEIVVSADNSLSYIADDAADCIFVMSVFNHMPDEDLARLLSAIARILKPTGQLFAYYVIPEEGAPNTMKTFRRSDVEMEKFLSDAGLEGRVVDDWDDDLSTRRTESRMRICIKKP